MSQAGGPNTVGRLDVVISATGAEATKAQLQAVGAEGGKAADTLKGKFDEFGKAIRGPIQSIQRITGAITGAIGVAFTFYQLGSKIREQFESAAEKAQKLTDALATAAATDRLRQLDAELQKLDAVLANRLDKGISLEEFIFGDSTGSVRKQIDILRKERAQAQREVNDVSRAKGAREDDKKDADERLKHERLIAASREEQSYFAKDAAEADEAAANARLDALDAEYKKKLQIAELSKKSMEEQREFVRSMRDEIRNALPAEKIVSDLGRIVTQLQLIAQQRGGR